MSSLKLVKNSQKPRTADSQSKLRTTNPSGQSFFAGFNPNSGSQAAISIANPQFGARSNSAAGKLHLKSFLG